MAPTPNAIDLTTVTNVQNWLNLLGTGPNAANELQVVQDCITAFSAYVLHITDRANADGSIPASSPFNAPVSYNEFYDGNGNDKLALRNWPITAVSSVSDTGVSIPQSSSVTSPGWVIDQSNKFLVIRGGVAFPGTFRALWSRGTYYRRCGWTLGTQNIQVQYTAGFSSTPQDLEMLARKIVALNYKRRGWIGQSSQAMQAPAAGTVSYGKDWFIDPTDRQTLFYYRALAA